MRIEPISPEQAEAFAATLPACSLPPDSTAEWSETAIPALGLSLRLPPGYSEQVDPEVEPLNMRVFTTEGAIPRYFYRASRAWEGRLTLSSLSRMPCPQTKGSAR